jgi:L-aspartate oxidase
MFDYDSRGELASRDIVSRGIESELKKSGEACVYLDCTHLEINAFQKHFPAITQYCWQQGIDVSKDWIPVVPTQHYLCGGITVNSFGQTSVENLFACGECSRTGLHGANRLASNSLLEAVVYAHRIFCFLKDKEMTSASFVFTLEEKRNKPQVSEEFICDRDMALRNLIQQNVGIVRNNEDLEKMKQQLVLWQEEFESIAQNYKLSKELVELRNKIAVAVSVVTSSLKRTENRGCFYCEG